MDLNRELRIPQPIRDVLWLIVGTFFIGGFIYNVVARAVGPGISLDAATVIGFVISVLITYWLGVGGLRRTSWMRRRHQAKMASMNRNDRDASV